MPDGSPFDLWVVQALLKAGMRELYRNDGAMSEHAIPLSYAAM